MIGKTLKCLKRKEEAITYLMKVYKFNIVTVDDKAVCDNNLIVEGFIRVYYNFNENVISQ